ncbi:MAG: cob(I)yrinic acid a,c-diamide adenosyltransferase [Thaumarchaeota archaeon]|nr:cob(I)yrinic acid a,c-diamide adenosyltransferase [Nitrososphaerota archaeon]
MLYTRKGDGGETSLFGSRRVMKDDPRVEAYGTIDELNSVIGAVIAASRNRRVVAQLKDVQRLLFVAGGDAATELSSPQKVPRIADSDTLALEKMADDLAEKLPTLKSFILPGGGQTGALIHLARSVCRRAERRVVSASRTEELNPALLPFLNRLSSYLFNLSRWVNKLEGKKEEVWTR